MDVARELVFLLRLEIPHYHIAVRTARIVTLRLLVGIQFHGKRLLSLCLHIYNESKFIIAQVAVKVVYLRRHFPVAILYHRINHIKLYVTQRHHHRHVTAFHVQRVCQFNLYSLSFGICHGHTAHQQCRNYSIRIFHFLLLKVFSSISPTCHTKTAVPQQITISMEFDSPTVS